eukprot:697886-Rhodomonas_salina.2
MWHCQSRGPQAASRTDPVQSAAWVGGHRPPTPAYEGRGERAGLTLSVLLWGSEGIALRLPQLGPGYHPPTPAAQPAGRAVAQLPESRTDPVHPADRI